MSLHTSIQAEASILIDRPREQVCRFVAQDFFDNYPRWSPEVTRLEKITPGPLGVGTRGRQVRNDAGYITRSTFSVTAYEPPDRIAFASTGSPHYRVRYTFHPSGDRTRVAFSFQLRLTPLLKPFEKLLEKMVCAQSERVVSNIRALLDQ
ncbi:MAG: SRPBCC family protein [Gammaproteobacteria bacterium]|jgi:hypothetical protein